MKRNIRWITAALAAVVLLAGYLTAFASHPGGDVTLRDAAGNKITDGATAYSPKATCSRACHIAAPDSDAVDFAGHNYGSGTKYSTHVQGVLGSDNNVYWQAYQNKSYEHGVSIGRHMNQGRNEDYTNADRAAVGDPFFTSSLGMFGKY